jgi:K+-sensing histidine kinase KdpD
VSGAIRGRALLAIAVTVVVAAAIVAGFLAAGSPKEARAERLDEQRVQHLMEIDRAVEQYYATHKRLPASLDDVADRTSLPLTVEDPETKTSYDYLPTGEREFDLCATFARDLEASDMQEWERKWAHGAGRHCFHRTVNRLP